ncbi:flagellar hook-length control protein FliK [Nitrosomonas sp.]|uniref:flagellar hook-length control protein FliK n=1 Tax=Nitrosomonas sp. TaxID=42353 RepID=UPI0025FF62DA|nr:flagellar hook-length control protein FliK [Nitrosomonas sp.]MCC6916479.1 flagellar hook-length control protein FliK [Nitrosomonas sp.]
MPNLPAISSPGLPAATSDPMTTLLPGAASPDTTGQPAEPVFGQVFGNILTRMAGEAPDVKDDTDAENPVLALPADSLMISMMTAPVSEPRPVPEAAPEELLSMLSANLAPDTGYPAADTPDISAGDTPLPAAIPANPPFAPGDFAQRTPALLQPTPGNSGASTTMLTPANERPGPARPGPVEVHFQQGLDISGPNGTLPDLANNQTTDTANFADSGKILPSAATPAAVHASGTPLIDSTDSTTKDSPAVAAEFGHPDWPEEFGRKITWLATQRMQAAELKLHPAHLGPIEISLQISADQQLTAHFISHHAGVRDAIEANLPRLREIMAENGITLTDTSVSADTPGQQAENGQQTPRHPAENGRGHFRYDSAGSQTSARQIIRHAGIIDTFA